MGPGFIFTGPGVLGPEWACVALLFCIFFLASALFEIVLKPKSVARPKATGVKLWFMESPLMCKNLQGKQRERVGISHLIACLWPAQYCDCCL
jgi:hypothetical protein